MTWRRLNLKRNIESLYLGKASGRMLQVSARRGTPRSQHWIFTAMVLEKYLGQLLQAHWRGTPRSRHWILVAMILEKNLGAAIAEVLKRLTTLVLGGQWSWRRRGCSCCRRAGEEHHAHDTES